MRSARFSAAPALAAIGLAAFSLGAAPAGGLDLSPYRGKVVYLDFWASWCAPCKLSFPYMHRLAAAHAADDFAVVTVDVDRSRDKADAFLAEMSNRLPVVYDPQGALARTYKIKGMPTTLLIGRDGRIRYVHEGFVPARAQAYETQIAELLHETP